MSANSTTCSLCPFVSSILFGGKNVGKCGDQSMLPGETGLEIKIIKTLRNGYIKNSWWNNVYHVIFSDLTDLWVIKPMILCARSTRSREQSTKWRMSETFVDFIVKRTRLYDYQTWQTCLSRNSGGAQRFVGFFSWLCFSDADWLGRETPITWYMI